MKKEVSAGVIIYREDEDEIKYLLLQYRLGHWGFVKGNMEKGEVEQETIIRETKEETGIIDLEFVEGFKEKESYMYRWEGNLISKGVIYLLAKTKTNDIKLSFEHKDYIWVTFDGAIKTLKFKNTKELLKKADGFLGENKINFQKKLGEY